jgi:hypothetical protein
LIKCDNSKDETMLETTLNWKPDPQTLTQLVQVAILEQRSLESLLDEAIAQYLQANLALHIRSMLRMNIKRKHGDDLSCMPI